MATAKETFDLTGYLLNITAIIASANKTHATYEQDVELFKAIKFILNFSHYIQKEEEWGLYNESTGKSTGMVRRILEGGTDLASTAAAKIPVRQEILDFTMTSYAFSFVAILQKRTFRGDPFALLRPFRWSLWLAVGLWCACIYNSIRAAAFLSRVLLSTRIDRDIHSSILPFSLLCGKSLPCSMQTTTWCRVIVCTGAVSAVVLNAAFSAVLLSFLFNSQENGSLNQLLSMGTFDFAIDRRNVFLFGQMLKGTRPSEFITIYRKHKKVEISFVERSTQMKILDGHVVAMTGELAAYDFLNDLLNPLERCAVTTATLPIRQQQWGCMVPKHSKYKRSIDYAILKSKEKGLLDLWQRRYTPQRPTCPTGGKYDAVPVKSIFLAVCIFCFGFLSSLVALAMEIWSHRQTCKQVSFSTVYINLPS